MRKSYSILGFAGALIAALACIESGDAQPQGKKGFGKKGDGPPRSVTNDQVVERILAFDKNNDGKIVMDELPERMQHLMAIGDLNKDGALDRSEITKLATTLESFAALTGNGGPGGPKGGGPKGDGFKGGFGKGAPPKGAIGEAERTLDELNVTGATREKADRVVRAQQDKLKKFDASMRAELVQQLKDVLNEEDYRVFKSAMERAPEPKGFPFPKGPPSADLERRIDQLKRELEELRQEIKK